MLGKLRNNITKKSIIVNNSNNSNNNMNNMTINVNNVTSKPYFEIVKTILYTDTIEEIF